MKKLFYLIAGVSAMAFTSCKSAVEPINKVDNEVKSETTTPKDATEEDGFGGVVAKGEDTYITLGLKDSEDLRKLGKTVRLEIGTLNYKDRAGVWIDLNGNGVKDANEKVTVFQQPKGGQTQQVYTAKTPYLRIYGKVNYISCAANNKFISADIKHNPYLQIFWASNNEIPSIDLSNSPELDFLYLAYNKISSIDLSKLPKLRELSVSGNKLKELNVDNNPALVNLHCDSNQIKSINVSHLKDLEYFTCAINNGIKFDITNNSKLRILFAAKCGLDNIDVTKNSKLESLQISLNNFSEVNVSNNPELKALDVTGCRGIKSLDLSQNPKLENLWINKTNIKGLEFSHNPMMNYLIMEYANLSTEELNTIFNTLPSVEKGNAAMDYRDNPGTKDADFSIVEKKGWIKTVNQYK